MSLVVRTASIGVLCSLLWLPSACGESGAKPASRATMSEQPTWETGSEEEGTFWQRVSAGTRGFFARTKAVLLPRRDPRPVQQASYRNRGRGFGNMFAPKERDAPATMKEWMELERPGDE
jgi:hypothetical protein